MQTFQDIPIEKLVFGGQALGHTPDGKPIFAWNALPNEVVDVQVTKVKQGNREGIATKIHRPSAHRIDPREEHFLSTSPWQVMSYEHELYWKKAIAQETYQRVGRFAPPDLEIRGNADRQFGYRNKMEYSFTIDEQGRLSLAFFARGQKRKIAVPESQLAYPWINQTAKAFLKWADEMRLTPRELKSLIVRGTQDGKAIAGLFVKDPLTFETLPHLDDTLRGYQIFYSTHKSPASVPTRLLYEQGDTFLTETLSLGNNENITLHFGLFSFFQVNVPMFQEALADIAKRVKKDTPLVDLYSGVGAIGLSFASIAKTTTLVDNVLEAIAFAQENITLNNALHTNAFCEQSENMLDLITADATIVIDPPRAGLHKKVITRLLEEKPPQIIYLSCDLATQARDIALLSDAYTITFARLYNFFPRTPHIESLCVLEKK